MSAAAEELDISSRDFQKVIEIHAKASLPARVETMLYSPLILHIPHSLQEGYKEGISDGRETEFQSGFDLGFQDGLRAGYATGQLTALSELNPTSVVAPKLPCECCKPGVLDHPPPLEKISEANRDAILNLEHLLPNKPGNA